MASNNNIGLIVMSHNNVEIWGATLRFVDIMKCKKLNELSLLTNLQLPFDCKLAKLGWICITRAVKKI